MGEGTWLILPRKDNYNHFLSKNFKKSQKISRIFRWANKTKGLWYADYARNNSTLKVDCPEPYLIADIHSVRTASSIRLFNRSKPSDAHTISMHFQIFSRYPHPFLLPDRQIFALWHAFELTLICLDSSCFASVRASLISLKISPSPTFYSSFCISKPPLSMNPHRLNHSSDLAHSRRLLASPAISCD